MSTPRTPPAIIWLKVFLRSNLHRVAKKLRGDKTEVLCVEDDAAPPPTYERKEKTLPAEGEVLRLRQELSACKDRLEAMQEDSPERRMLLRDAEMLDRWIDHLEHLHTEQWGRTVPARMRREPYRDRIRRRIKNLGRAAEPEPEPRVVVGVMW
ncbi:hypothetical protein CCMA1212_005278 [Trichoderma ghanense]|uniref:Uncharacterized protein n=1 Tax=Trichoderma ghanense TaxID=65468 RepID=A0ABY2H7C6_9HYPO